MTEQQIVIAAEVTVEAPDFAHLEPAVRAAQRELKEAGVSERPAAIVADAGYWHTQQIQTLANEGFTVLVPPDGGLRDGERPGWQGEPYDAMRRTLASQDGKQLYRKRKLTIEPVFGQLKHNRRCNRFQLRGRAAARSEWRLIMATHNLLKLHNHWTAPVTG